jgi:SAM-dependent methyltransferase
VEAFDPDVVATHAERYRVVEDPAMRAVELRVIGCDYGATSYTTRAQAEHMAEILDLGPGRMLLDIGSGAGWPGIHLAAGTGARVVLSDIPREGLGVARRRIERDGVDALVVAAAGHRLPFPDASFDAVTSSDVLCCVPDKASALAEARRVLRPEGRICFSVITVADGLSGTERERAVEHGPPHVDSGAGYGALLAAAGFTAVAVLDVTEEFLSTSTAWVSEWEAGSAELSRLVGEEVFVERQATRSEANRVIAAGLLRRSIASAVRPG